MTEKLNYEKPTINKKNNQYLMSRRSVLLKNKADKLTNDEK